MNFGTPVPLLIGIVLIVGAVALFFLDKLKPGYGRDSDKVYAILWLVSGVFLLGHLTMELLPSFQQLLMAGMLISLTIENIYARTPKDDRYAAQGSVDSSDRSPYYRPSRTSDYRPSRDARMNVKAEIDNDAAYRRFPEDRRMIRGREESGMRRPDYYGDGYGDRYGADQSGADSSGYSSRPSRPEGRPVERLNPGSDRIRRRRPPRSVDSRYEPGPVGGWDESSTGYAANSGGYSSHSPTEPSPTSDYGREGGDSYVDYRPVNSPNDETGKPPADYGSRY